MIFVTIVLARNVMELLSVEKYWVALGRNRKYWNYKYRHKHMFPINIYDGLLLENVLILNSKTPVYAYIAANLGKSLTAPIMLPDVLHMIFYFLS